MKNMSSFQLSGTAGLLRDTRNNVPFSNENVGDSRTILGDRASRLESATSSMRFRTGVSECFNLPPQRSGVSLSARSHRNMSRAWRMRSFDNKVVREMAVDERMMEECQIRFGRLGDLVFHDIHNAARRMKVLWILCLHHPS